MENIYVDRSRIEEDWKCPRSRYWRYEWDGLGLVKEGGQYELAFGSVLHDAAAGIASGQSYETVIDEVEAGIRAWYEGQQLALDEAYREQVTLAVGLATVLYDHVWPTMVCDEVLATEEDMSLEIAPGMRFMSKPDLLYRSGGITRYREYKTTGRNTMSWVRGWEYAVQLQTGMHVAEQVHPEWAPVSVCEIVGLYKGYRKQGQWYSPLVYGYRSPGIPGVVPEQWSGSYTRGWQKVGVWEYPGGMRKYVNEVLTQDQRSDQVVLVPPIMKNDELIGKFLQQTIRREYEIAHTMEHPTPDLIEQVFPQHFDKCNQYDRECAYKELCWNPWMCDNPLVCGGYVVRQPHHQAEEEGQG